MSAAAGLVFVPGVGFRAATGAMLVTPVSAERGEWSVTIERLVVNPEKTELVFALTGPEEEPALGPGPLQPPSWARLPVSLRAGDQLVELTNEGRQGGSEMSAGYGSTRRLFRPTLRFPPLAAGTDQLEVVFDGPPGNWAIPLTLTPSTVYGLPAHPLRLTQTHHGVTLSVRAIARSESMTAIDVYATLEATPQPRFMRSLGVVRHGRRDDPEFTLVDDTGREVREFAVFDDEVAIGRELHQILVFPPLHADARKAELTIADVVLAESIGQWTTLPVPADTDTRFGPFEVHAKVTREQTRRGSVVRVTLDDGGWRDGRRLLYPETVRVDGRHGGIGWEGARPAGKPSAVDAPDPQGDVREVMLESPVVHLRGPWHFQIDLAGAGT